jgi:hypothetical protein
VADIVISAKRSSTRASVIRRTTWETPSLIGGGAYLWQHPDKSGLEGGRDEASVLGNRTNEYAESIAKPVIYYSRWCLTIRKAQSPAT